MIETDALKSKQEILPYNIRIHPNSSIKAPPQWLLLDHTLAVLWLLYNSNQKLKDKLDIEQLKWAHLFLKGIISEKKENLPDIKNCITDIEDRLIAQYAGLNMNRKSSRVIEEEDSSLEITILSKTDPELLRSIKSIEEKEVEIKKEEEKEIKIKIEKEKEEKKYIKKTAPLRKFKPIELKQSKRSEAAFNEYIERLLEKRNANNSYWNSKLDQDRKSSKSVISTIPTPKKKTKRIRFSASNTSSNLLDLKKKKENCKAPDDAEAFSKLKADFQGLTANSEVSNSELMDFLKEWRTEQVDKIQVELKKLGSIEELMKTVNMGDFEPFMEAEVVEKLSKIDQPKNQKCS